MTRPMVTETEMQDSLAGRQQFIPDSAGGLWVLRSNGRVVSLTQVEPEHTIKEADSGVSRDVPGTP